MHTGVESIPTFTASAPISSKTASICFSIMSGVTSWMAITRLVFSATTDTTTLMPKTPWAENVLRSAWIPAPPLQSEPATVNTLRMARTSLLEN